MAQFLRYGVTTVLEMFGAPMQATAKRAAADNRDDVADYRTAGWGPAAPAGR